MKAEQSRPIGQDPDGHIGTRQALGRALNAPLLVDQAADADFARLMGRLRGEPGSNGGNQ